jgi:Flp pilus assembly protein TadD
VPQEVKSGDFHKYEGEHLVLKSDASQGRSIELLKLLDKRYVALSRYVFNYQPPLKKKIDVTFLRGLKDLRALGVSEWVGYFSGAYEEYTAESTIVVAGRATPAAYEATATHEMVHRFVAHHFPQAPVWLNEGLAKSLETVEWRGDHLVFGRHPLAKRQEEDAGSIFYWAIEPDQAIGLPQLRTMSPREFYAASGGAYASAWAAIQVLNEGKLRGSFQSYLDALQEGRLDEDVAFDRAYGSLDLASLKQKQVEILGHYTTEKRTITGAVEPVLLPPTVTSLEAWEIHVLWARVLLQGNLELALEHAQRAEAVAPHKAEPKMMVGIILQSLKRPGALKKFQEASETSKKAPRYVAAYLRASLLAANPLEAPQQIVRPLLSTAQTPQELEAVALFLLKSGRTSAALKYASRALQKDLSRPSSMTTLARVQAQRGCFRLAAKLERQAQVLGGHSRDLVSARLLTFYEQQAASQPDGKNCATRLVTQTAQTVSLKSPNHGIMTPGDVQREGFCHSCDSCLARSGDQL